MFICTHTYIHSTCAAGSSPLENPAWHSSFSMYKLV